MSERVAPYRTRAGGCMTTFTGRDFWPLEPHQDDVVIEDIAHALSLLCRFAGHTRTFYSVAQHSVLVSYACHPAHALAGLLHDAAEAYVVDLPRPLKRLPELTGYRLIEAAVHRAITRRFGLAPGLPPSVIEADELVLAWEQRDLRDRAPVGVEVPTEPLVPWAPAAAERAFLDRFHALTRGECR